MRPPKLKKYIDTKEDKIKRTKNRVCEIVGSNVECAIRAINLVDPSGLDSFGWLSLYKRYIDIHSVLNAIHYDGFISYKERGLLFCDEIKLMNLIGYKIGIGCIEDGDRCCLDIDSLEKILSNLSEFLPKYEI